MEIKELLTKYQNQYGMISNISELLSELSQYYSSSEILNIEMQILRHNNQVALQLQKQIAKIEEQQEYIPKIPKIESPTQVTIVKSPGPKKETDVSPYLAILKKAENKNEILDTIRNLSNPNLLTTIYYKLWEEIIFYKKLLHDSNSFEDTAFCNEELNNLNMIVLTVSNYIEMLKKGKNANISTNKIVFLSNNGSNCFLEDLEKIDHSEYPAFDSLLTSIINGTFNKLRTFYTTGNTIYEIRSVNKHRILCDRLGKDIYIILQGFRKNNDFVYEYTPSQRYNLYMKQKEYLKQLIDCNDEEFWKQQEQELKDVWKKLEHDARRK
ncbi:MAG: hypothetical protein IJR82_02575 [Bacilli bacterium]|nr:hypothetical protein [Bacilli bacterium]